MPTCSRARSQKSCHQSTTDGRPAVLALMAKGCRVCRSVHCEFGGACGLQRTSLFTQPLNTHAHGRETSVSCTQVEVTVDPGSPTAPSNPYELLLRCPHLKVEKGELTKVRNFLRNATTILYGLGRDISFRGFLFYFLSGRQG